VQRGEISPRERNIVLFLVLTLTLISLLISTNGNWREISASISPRIIQPIAYCFSTDIMHTALTYVYGVNIPVLVITFVWGGVWSFKHPESHKIFIEFHRSHSLIF